MSILKRCPDILTLSRTLLSNSRTPKTGKIIRLSNKVLVDQHVKCSKVSEAAEVRYRYVCEDHECTLLESVCLCLMSSPAKLRDWPIHHHREAKSKKRTKRAWEKWSLTSEKGNQGEGCWAWARGGKHDRWIWIRISNYNTNQLMWIWIRISSTVLSMQCHPHDGSALLAASHKLRCKTSNTW